MPRGRKAAGSNKKQPLDIKNLCTPSMIFFIISVIGFIALVFQNLGNDKQMCVGNYNCNVGNTFLALVVNAIYILFWTWILDLICKAGYSEIAWFVLLLPIILFFVAFGALAVKGGI